MPADKPSLFETTLVWGKIGVLSFGGPAAQISLMHREIIEQRNWLTERQFLNALSFCMLLPGPEAMQLATYAGWRLHGIVGGLIAGLLFVFPGAAVVMALAVIYSRYGSVPQIEALFYGVKAAVLVIVIGALANLAKKSLPHMAHWIIAGSAFTAIFFLSIPYPLIVLAAAIAGAITTSAPIEPKDTPAKMVSATRTLGTVFIWLAIWFAPLGALAFFGAPDILIEVGKFFSTLAIVTFGGAYAVLAYMAQDAVAQLGWLSAEEMIDALALAETTPGPLILVTQFVGFLAGFKEGGPLVGLGAASVVLWVTFIPCFLWIFAGAPYIEWISSQPRLRGALDGITAAVVGVILNLSIWFGLHVMFLTVDRAQFGPLTFWLPDVATIDLLAFTLFLLSCLLAFWRRWDAIKLLLLTSVIGTALKLAL